MPHQNDAHATAAPARTLLIEGWRGVNHSFALMNQQQILELLKFDDLRLYHRDLPFVFNHWSRYGNGSGFGAEDWARIDALGEPPVGAHIDCVYRICSPIHAGAADDHRRTVTCMITEVGLAPGSFAAGHERSDFFTRGDNSIVTLSEWSRARIIEYGYPADKVRVVSLGVDTSLFRPLAADERAISRARLGIHPDEAVFVNVGVAVWNKGIDLLLRAFAVLRARGRRVRLLLKDQRDLYKLSIEHLFQSVGADCPELLRPETMAAITVIPSTLDRSQLRSLFCIADAYVSPYRAEGFNLPALEAIACATPLIVTAGGATDDFCDDAVAWRIPSVPGASLEPGSGALRRFVEPDFDALVAAMDAIATGGQPNPDGYAAARAKVLRRFTWSQAAAELAAITVGRDLPPVTAAPEPPPERAVSQREILELLKLIRPMAMASGGKVRVGNTFDGGYVLPERALACDGVLSIGVGSDVSFDLCFAERGAKVLQFDHTVEQSPTAHANFQFHKLGWGTGTDGSLLSFADIRAAFAPVQAKRALLKFDVEGAEYETLPAMAADDLDGFEVIACELHDLARLGERAFFNRVRTALVRLTCGHAPVHLHANNYRPVIMVLGVPIPDVLEITLLRRDLDTFPGLSEEPIPGPLDGPNHPLAPDICMRAF